MRVAYVCLDPGVPVFGRKGSSVHCQEVMRALQKRGFDIELFGTRLGDDVPPDLRRIRKHKIPCPEGRHSHQREKALINLNPEVYRMLDNAEPFDLIYERYALWSFSAMRFAHERGIPGVLEVNSPLINEQKTYRKLHDESAAKHIRGRCFRYASSLIAVSEQVAEQVRKNYFAQFKTTTIPNGVNGEKFQSVSNGRSYGVADKTVVGFVGTLKPWHGVSNLLDAFAFVRSSNPNVELRIVGEGPQREHLQNQISGYSRDVQQAIGWLGAVPNANIPKVLSTFDVAVAPYPDLQDFYFSPLKIMEYMAAGLPVVASRIGQIPTLIDHGVSGLLVSPGCTKETASAIQQLCDDHRMRNQLGCAARRHVEVNHTWRSVVDRILATIPSLTVDSYCEVR